MGGKLVIIDQLPWHTRPWEIEACHWQVELVDEFLTLASGSQPFLQLQKPGKQRLALLAASLPAVAVANGHDINGHNGNGHASPGVAPNGHSPARKAVELIDGVLQITVPGLDTPRALEQGGLIAKRQDLQNRGLLRSAV